MDLGPELQDFCDTAAAISQLDLVICVDTAVAHLAGALGRPVWLLLPRPADWRWLEEREDSPWYPTMRLFRQRRRGDWGDVLERVAAALERWTAGEEAKLTPRANRAAPAPSSLEPHADQWPPAGHRPGFSAVAETRAGILQYLPDQPDVGAAIGMYGEVLQTQLNLLTRLLRPGSTVLEAGAGVGAHALAIAAALGPAGHLLLYETRPVVRRILQQNLVANGIGNVTVMRRGLGLATDPGSSDRATGAGAEMDSVGRIAAGAPGLAQDQRPRIGTRRCSMVAQARFGACARGCLSPRRIDRRWDCSRADCTDSATGAGATRPRCTIRTTSIVAQATCFRVAQRWRCSRSPKRSKWTSCSTIASRYHKRGIASERRVGLR